MNGYQPGVFVYEYSGDVTAAGTSNFDAPKGAIIVDPTNKKVGFKTTARKDNSGIRNFALEGASSLTDGTTVTVDTTAARVFAVTLAGNRTFDFTGHSAGREFVLKVKQDATGSRTVTWDADVVWSGGTNPTLTTTAAKTDVFHFTDDGVKYIGRTVGLNYTI